MSFAPVGSLFFMAAIVVRPQDHERTASSGENYGDHEATAMNKVRARCSQQFIFTEWSAFNVQSCPSLLLL